MSQALLRPRARPWRKSFIVRSRMRWPRDWLLTPRGIRIGLRAKSFSAADCIVERHATTDCGRVYPGTVAEAGLDGQTLLVPDRGGGSDDPLGNAALFGAPHEGARALGKTRSHASGDRARHR